MKKKITQEEIDADEDYYCKKCGTCGYIGCCGVKSFLEHHVKGKTNCPHEEQMIAEIINEINIRE